MGFLPFAAVVGLLALVAINPPQVLFIVFLLYAASGPLLALWRRLHRPKA
jgi:CDP-diacylglycerol--serine O-phosphatidyltransferase